MLTGRDIESTSAYKPRSRPRLTVALGLAVLMSPMAAPAPAPAATPLVKSPEISRRWSIDRRVQTQDQGDWQVDYTIRLDSPSPVTLQPADLGLTLGGLLSNSRVTVHALPRPVSTSIGPRTGANVLADVIPSGDELHRCRERLVVRFWSGESTSPPTPIAAHPPLGAPASAVFEPLSSVTVAPGGLLRVRIRLEHDHFLYGAYDPLLGNRQVEFRLGPDVLRDTIPLDREQYLAQGRDAWPAPPEDRRDTRYSVTGPDSLYLEAEGNPYYRFTEKPVRYSTKMRLTFWYLIAPGTQGDLRVQIAQYKDSPHGWQVLHAGAIDRSYTAMGRWMKVEQTFRTEAEATSLALVFKVFATDEVGEIWVDDVTLEPVGATADRP